MHAIRSAHTPGSEMKPSFGSMRKIFCGCLLLAAFLWFAQARAASVLTQHNDLSRSGANLSEVLLTPGNVNSNNFGSLFTNSVDGQVYAQPLYVENLSISGAKYDVVFVCTENNSVYAFDADAPGKTYWHTNLGTPFTPSCGDLTPTVGITGTPVIDLKSGTMYLDTKLAAGPAHKLHALDITNGHEKFGGPVTIAASLFSASLEHQREGLLLLNGVVYLGFSSHCDQGAYHGFLIGYNATNLTQTAVFDTTPTGSRGGIWSGGMAPAADAEGNIYIAVGNGTFDGTANFSESIVKLSANLTVEDYATPTNYDYLSQKDYDLGSGGPLLLPTHYVVVLGKDGNMYLADVNQMGQVGNFVQVLGADQFGDTIGPSPVFWQAADQSYIFAMHSKAPTKSFIFTGTNFSTNAVGTSSYVVGNRVGGLSLSANGTTNGVLWEIGDDSNLRAYDAANFPNLLWTGSIGTYVKMTCPTIANGKVYVGTANSLVVAGLTNHLYTQTVASHPGLNWSIGTLLQSSNLAGPWWTNGATSPYYLTPTNWQMFYRLLLGTGP